MIADILNVYGQEVAPHRRTASNIGYNIGALLEWWGNKNVAEISTRTCREYVATKKEQAAAQHLKILRAAVNYWHKEYGPLSAVPTFYTPPPSAPRERWLSRDECARLLRAAKSVQYLRRFILLGIYTGSRPGIILKLKWSQVNFQSGVLVRTQERQARNKKSPPVKLGRRILGHLSRWHRADTERHLTASDYVCGGFDDPHKSWKRIVKAAKLEGVTRHTLRHTRATWLMQAGVPIWEAAGHLGMTTRTLETVYGKHAPDYQEHAANI